MKRMMLVGVILLSLGGVSFSQKDKPDEAAVERARKAVKMLDDVYKTAIVLITDKYVETNKDYPAGRLAVIWFKNLSGKGHHQVRLIDATGEPDNPRNVAEDDFEKKGVKELKAGKAYYDEVVMKDGKTYLRAVTAVPVVMEKCTLCHPNYKDVPKGQAIGAISYTMPIE
jgi:hypothetical protein